MLIFIDESGIHKKDVESVVVLAYVEVDDAENLQKAIVKAEEILKISSFHWTKHIWKIRMKFIRLILKEKFFVKAAIIQGGFNQEKFEESIKFLLTEKKIEKIIICSFAK